jgi:vancomycin resistance protein VanJ
VATWGPLFTPLPTPAAAEGASLTVMTLNVLADNPKHGELAVAISAEDPDLVALQELEPDAAADLARVLADRYPHQALVPEVKRGAGVLSKLPLREAEPLQLVEEGNWGQRLVVETPFGPITHFNVHPKVPRLVHSVAGFGPLRLPIDYDSSQRSAEVQQLTELLDQTDGAVLMTGDFNLSEYSRDYRLLRERLEDGYRGAGWGFGLTFPRRGSFPKALPAPWPVVRLDYVWHSADLEPIAAWVGPSGGSDHRSVVVRFTRAGVR